MKLLYQLPLNDSMCVGMLYKAGSLPLNTGAYIKVLKTRAEKVSYFLQHIIEPAASDTLATLIKVMQNCTTTNLVKLVSEIQVAAEPGTCSEVFY